MVRVRPPRDRRSSPRAATVAAVRRMSPSPAPGPCAHPPCPQSRRTLLAPSARCATSAVGGAQGIQRRPPALPIASTDSNAMHGSRRTSGATSWRRSGGCHRLRTTLLTWEEELREANERVRAAETEVRKSLSAVDAAKLLEGAQQAELVVLREERWRRERGPATQEMSGGSRKDKSEGGLGRTESAVVDQGQEIASTAGGASTNAGRCKGGGSADTQGNGEEHDGICSRDR